MTSSASGRRAASGYAQSALPARLAARPEDQVADGSHPRRAARATGIRRSRRKACSRIRTALASYAAASRSNASPNGSGSTPSLTTDNIGPAPFASTLCGRRHPHLPRMACVPRGPAAPNADSGATRGLLAAVVLGALDPAIRGPVGSAIAGQDGVRLRDAHVRRFLLEVVMGAVGKPDIQCTAAWLPSSDSPLRRASIMDQNRGHLV